LLVPKLRNERAPACRSASPAAGGAICIALPTNGSANAPARAGAKTIVEGIVVVFDARPRRGASLDGDCFDSLNLIVTWKSTPARTA